MTDQPPAAAPDPIPHWPTHADTPDVDGRSQPPPSESLLVPNGPQPAPRKRWLPWAVAAAALAALAVVVGVLFAGGVFTGPPLVAAQKACDAGKAGTQLADGDRTLLVDTRGEEDASGLTSEQAGCILRELGATAAVVSRMGQTRALDGRQEGAWKGFTASWTYHPDDGLDMVIEQA